MFDGANDPGTYEVTTGDKTVEVEADRWGYSQDSSRLEFHAGGQVVATFNWWDSVRLKPSTERGSA